MTRGNATSRGPKFGVRGQRLWDASLAVKPDLNPGELVLLEEGCRLADRLDKFDALISGDASVWAQVEWPYEDAPAALVISSAVGEARQSVAELRQVVKALALPSAAAPAKPEGGILRLLDGAG